MNVCTWGIFSISVHEVRGASMSPTMVSQKDWGICSQERWVNQGAWWAQPCSPCSPWWGRWNISACSEYKMIWTCLIFLSFFCISAFIYLVSSSPGETRVRCPWQHFAKSHHGWGFGTMQNSDPMKPYHMISGTALLWPGPLLENMNYLNSR